MGLKEAASVLGMCPTTPPQCLHFLIVLLPSWVLSLLQIHSFFDLSQHPRRFSSPQPVRRGSAKRWQKNPPSCGPATVPLTSKHCCSSLLLLGHLL